MRLVVGQINFSFPCKAVCTPDEAMMYAPVVHYTKSVNLNTSRSMGFWLNPREEEGFFLVIVYWGCAAGWGHIFTSSLTITGSPYQAFLTELPEWGLLFWKKIISPQSI